MPQEPALALTASQANTADYGYTMVPNYALYFWRPYLGNTAFSLWELLLSFCYGDCDTAYPSISRLARMLTNSDHSRAVVTGRRGAKGAASRGALAILQQEGLVQVIRRGHGPTLSYTFRVLKSLPLLQPEQVARLSPSLQRDHAAWLERHSPNPVACRHTPAATSFTPVEAERTAHAPGGTNNNQEKDLLNNWWQETLKELHLQLTRSAFQTCLLGTQACSFQNGTLTIKAPGALAREILEHRLAPLVLRTLAAVSAAKVQQVRFVCSVQANDTEEQCAP